MVIIYSIKRCVFNPLYCCTIFVSPLQEIMPEVWWRILPLRGSQDWKHWEAMRSRALPKTQRILKLRCSQDSKPPNIENTIQQMKNRANKWKIDWKSCKKKKYCFIVRRSGASWQKIWNPSADGPSAIGHRHACIFYCAQFVHLHWRLQTLHL